MRHGRAKAARKTLQFFERVVNIKPPYHILLDGTFVVAVIKYKVPLFDRLDRLLQHATVHLHITPTALAELDKLAQHAKGDKLDIVQEARDWAKQNCELIDDNESLPSTSVVEAENPRAWDKLSDAGKDVMRLVGYGKDGDDASTRRRYFVASQDEQVLDLVRNFPNTSIPVIRLARGSVLLLENPSKTASHQASRDEKAKWSVAGSVTAQEKVLVNIVKQKTRQDHAARKPSSQSSRPPSSRHKQKAKGPNPLSCKKKRDESTTSSSSNKRRRTKK